MTTAADGRERDAAQALQLVGKTVGKRYTVKAFIGQGSYAAVYRATDLQVRASVAIKVAKPGCDAESLYRFDNEARITSTLPPHPNVARSLDRGAIEDNSDFNGRPFLVTDLIDGEPLSKLFLKGGRFSVQHTIDIATQMLEALRYLHRRGIVHRDIKPNNIMVELDGSPRLIDFGFAFATGEDRDFDRSPDLTGATEVVGTPHYMSPEQVGGGTRPQPSFDVYALGATLYEALSGMPPFGYDDRRSVMRMKRTDKITPVHLVRSETPEDFAALVDSMLTRDAEQRPSASALLGTLRSITAPPPVLEETPETPAPSVALPPVLDAPPLPAYAIEPSTAPALTTAKRRRAIAIVVAILGFGLLCLSMGKMIVRPKAEHLSFAFRFPKLTPPEFAEPTPELAEPTPPEPTPVLPAPVEPPPPKRDPKPKRHPKPTRSTPKPAPSPSSNDEPAACLDARHAAERASKSDNPRKVLLNTNDARCWKGHAEDRKYLRAAALLDLGQHAACVRAGKGTAQARTRSIVQLCASMLSKDR